MDIETHPLTRDDLPAIERVLGAAFGEPWPPEEREVDAAILDWARTYGVRDGTELVGQAADLPLQLTVPGGAQVPCAGVTWVSVLPTHRRRGILTGMMRQQLADIRDRGEPLALLWASESVIYGRFGYGLATQQAEYVLRGRDHRVAAPDDAPAVRLLARDEAIPELKRIFDEVRRQRAGMIGLSPAMWEGVLLDTDARRAGHTALFFAVAGEDHAAAFALYRAKGNMEGQLAANQVRVLLVMGTDPAAEAALWRYLLGVDLTTEWTIRRRPLDDALPWMLADPRRLRRDVYDATWLRIVDVAAALRARSYAADGELRLEVVDGFCPWNEGTYVLAVDQGRGEVERADGGADLRLSAADLGALYLGGVRPGVLAAAGRVDELRAGALARADAMFTGDHAPWCPIVF